VDIRVLESELKDAEGQVEMQDISCNSLVLRHVCRRAVDLFHTC
jgi:hypothetical protein